MGFNYEPNKKAATATLKLLPSELKALKMSDRRGEREEESRRAEPVAASLWKAMEEIKHERGQEKKTLLMKVKPSAESID